MRIAILLLGLILVASVQAEDASWQERKIEDGISVFSRYPPDSRYEEFKAITEVTATVAEAMALLDDTNACPRWLHRCKESRVLEQTGNTERLFYQPT